MLSVFYSSVSTNTQHQRGQAKGVCVAGPAGTAAIIWPVAFAGSRTALCQASSRDSSRGVDGTNTQPVRRRGRPRKTPPTSSSNAALVQELIRVTQLPLATAERLVAAKAQFHAIPLEPGKLCQRVQQLQQLLGFDYADLALRRYPNLMSHSPETLALNYQQWQQFFAPDGAADSASASDAHQAQQKALLHRLASSPQLLGVDVERQVGNLYEAGVLIQAEDLHRFAYNAMDLGLARPHVLQEKIHRTLIMLNTAGHQQQGQQEQEQAGQSSSRGISAAADQRFTLSDVQQAARRDHNWLTLSSDTLQQRLLGLHEHLQLPLPVVGRMFVQQPSIVNKRPALIGERAAALQQLPDINPDRALAAIVALPTLLNLRSEVVQHRWQQLQEAASTHPDWSRRLGQLKPSSLASVLVRSQRHYDRLHQVVRLGQQDKLSLVTVLNLSEQKFLEKFTPE